MFYYNLVSCTPLLYPDLGPYYTEVAHPLSGELIYVRGDFDKHYTLTPTTDNVQALGAMPKLILSPYTTCAESEHYYTLVSCRTGQKVAYLFTFAQNVGDVLVFTGICDAFEIIEWDGTAVLGVAPSVDATFTGETACFDALQYLPTVTCEVSEVTKGYAVRALIPEQPQQDRGFKECCFELKILASSTETDNHKNDFTSFYHKLQTNSDSVTFILVRLSDNSEYTLTGGTYGTLNTSNNLTTFRLEWKQVLQGLGAGPYRIKKEVTTAGVTVDITSNTYSLYEYTAQLADKTVRFDADISGKFENLGITFDNYETTMRVPGFFGRPEAQYTTDTLIHSDFSSQQISTSVEREYKFQSNMLPSCITEELLYFTFLADNLKATDYNANNHKYDIIELPIELGDNGGSEYFVYKRDARLNLTFKDKFKNILKRNC